MEGLIEGPLGGHYRIMTESTSSCSEGRYCGEQTEGRRWVAFGSEIAFGGSTVRFYELDEGGRCVARSQHPLSDVDITFVHDMVVTENYYGLVLGPIEVRRANSGNPQERVSRGIQNNPQRGMEMKTKFKVDGDPP